MTELLSTNEPVRDFSQALRFFRLMNSAELPREITQHRHLGLFAAWQTKQSDADARMARLHGAPRGLLGHIKQTHGWYNNDAKFDPKTLDEDEGESKSNVELGKRVDTELALAFVSRASTAAADAAFRASLDSYTIKVIMFFATQRWLPCAFQTPLWSADGQVRTWVDMIVYDLANKYFVLIELKTGYLDHTFHGVLKKASPIEFFDRTPHNMCHLQLGWMFHVLMHGAETAKPLPGPFKPALLRVNQARLLDPEELFGEIDEYYCLTFGHGVRDDIELCDLLNKGDEGEESDDTIDDDDESALLHSDKRAKNENPS
jgi:hypothetical protein